MNRTRREKTVAIVAALLALGTMLWGVLAEQLGDTLFNATLV